MSRKSGSKGAWGGVACKSASTKIRKLRVFGSSDIFASYTEMWRKLYY